jgi:hypothetical protein
MKAEMKVLVVGNGARSKLFADVAKKLGHDVEHVENDTKIYGLEVDAVYLDEFSDDNITPD